MTVGVALNASDASNQVDATVRLARESAADPAVIGDEKTVEAEVRRYRDAGATEVVFSVTEIAGETDRRRTWRLLGELAR
ncbi:hypothetical protein GCM10010503_39880 [Streptomyces lucensis JCM 4490]|uniref:Uncharacterized protein n=1 Tax=Streptomyces lucensis JCM 4490 TaxID=1306176 RepID=A0A918J893_9ACTN|nr:hypothetical protein GCM10010503_39880 [Streptomyces lucensis JCM 4490]